ncbi:hypothetical protein Droror1_Dr00021415 [Drosera rotundifolia]
MAIISPFPTTGFADEMGKARKLGTLKQYIVGRSSEAIFSEAFGKQEAILRYLGGIDPTGELDEKLHKVEEKLKSTEGILGSKNLENKKINEDKKAALAAQYAAETMLRRVHAARKDDEMPPFEAILAPLEAEMKQIKMQVSLRNIGPV